MQANTILNQTDVANQVRLALAEDVGGGDITAHLIQENARSNAELITREDAIMCGQPWANETFRQLGGVELDWQVDEGEPLVAGQTLCRLTGNSRQLLTGERTALNFLQLLMATATRAARYAKAFAGEDVTILDTRKTIPGLRLAQKYAVKCGGCHNHRLGLHDAFLIKENHIAACGSITAAVETARRLANDKHITVEVECLSELKEAIAAKPDQIMLDNFDEADIAIAKEAHLAGIIVEVSGNLDLEVGNIPRADFPVSISSGALTKHVQAIDLSMRLIKRQGTSE